MKVTKQIKSKHRVTEFGEVNTSFETIENIIDLEIEDLQTQKLEFTVLTKPSDLFQIVDQIEKKGYLIKSSTLEYIAKSYLKIEANMADKAITLMDCLDSHEDVQNIYSNLEFEEKVLN